MPAVPLQTINAGETSDAWEVGLVTSPAGASQRTLADLSDAFTCRLIVIGAQPPIERQVLVKNTANTRFLAWLTEDETRALGKGNWQVVIELRNPALVPALVRQSTAVVAIRDAVMPPP